MTLTTEEWKRLSSRIVDDSNGCWISNWSLRNPDSYTQFYLRGKMTFVHVVMYEYLKGSVPEGRELDHLCRVKTCVNPGHLEPVTRLENVRRGNADYKKNTTHCPKGHEYTEENTGIHVYKEGYSRRYCKECNRGKARATYYRHEAWIKKFLE